MCLGTCLVPARSVDGQPAGASRDVSGLETRARERAASRTQGFNLFAFADFAATGMRSTSTFRFLVSNAGPMDIEQNLFGLVPAQALRSGTFYAEFTELTVYAAAAPGDWSRNRGMVPSLANALGGGAAVSYNYHFANPGVSSWTAIDGALGLNHRGVRSTSNNTCLNHTASGLPAGVTLMAGSDCPQTWGLSGFAGRPPVSPTAYRSVFAINKAGFRFNFFDVPRGFLDTTQTLGDRFATFGSFTDYGRERRVGFGKVLPGGLGDPKEPGYPLGLEWRFDAFTLNATPGVVYWQATVTNRSRDIYNVPLDYDSLYVGALARHGRSVRTRAGFDIQRGTAFFNEIGHNSTCDNAKSVPGSFSFGAYTGNCAPVGFGNGASAIVFLKSPIGDLRYKQFTDSSSSFFFPTSPVAGDTITYNMGHLCGDDCIQDRFSAPGTGFGVLASREALALGGTSPAALDPFQYWQLFHPANGALYGLGPRVDASNPRAGGGFNFFVPGTWRYATRPLSAPATGGDTLFLDTCHPIANRCVGIWLDTLPDRSIDFTRSATWVGAGPFHLAADSSAAMVLAIVAAPDSAGIEQSVNQAIALYQGFFIAPTAPPAPRVAAAQVIGGSTRQTLVRIFLDNRTIGYVDPFIQALSDRFRSARAGTVEGRLNQLNPRIGPAGRSLADTLATLARANVAQILVYKSCDNGRNFTSGSSPNFCTRDVVRDTLGRELGPAAYRTMSADSVVFTDGNVLAGQSYYYAFVPVTRGVKLALLDSTFATGRRAFDTTFVAPTSVFPTSAAAPNVAVVYVPASLQAGAVRSAVMFTQETGPSTLNPTRDTSFNTPTVTALDSLSDTASYRLVVGDTVVVKEYSTNNLVDSTVVIVRRTVPKSFTYLLAIPGVASSAYAQPVRARADTLRFVSRTRATLPIFGTVPASLDSTVGAQRVRTVILGNAGQFVSNNTASPAVGPLGQAVLVSVRGGVEVPVAIGNDLRPGQFTTNSRVLSSLDFGKVNVDVANRPILIAQTSSNAGGAQFLDKFWAIPRAGRILSSDRPTLDWQQTASRLLGTNAGELIFTFAGPEFGPRAPFSYAGGLAPLQTQFTASFGQRTNSSTTVNDASSVAAINTALKTSFTADSLLVINLPFTIVDASNNRVVKAAMQRADKYATYLLGTAPDTARVTVPADQWVPGEPLILLENASVADTLADGTIRRDANGRPVFVDVLTVLAYRAVIGCSASSPFTCNPLAGRGGTGYISADPGQELHVRYAVPFTSDREFAFRVSPLVAGTRLRSVTAAMLDSVNVVPNPYVLYSNFETNPTNEQRIMFTHLPPRGVIRIYTASGQFVQQIIWTPTELANSGDLYFNLLTREGTEMASGLYVFTVTATDDSGRKKSSRIGRFIIIR
ncbi:MAG: hypothetical protein ACR2OG_15320 [Gemmatimonadaceae bacterium]